ncbi:hypothetical protein E2C01_069198 [Portunus trituberculatus]|uniref:Uncharacterized protein n=1 Tax=Portunus trituberculatus TaxID=210409 RepID=A0A5B7HXY0_PORTR|nr:hypothetical protein [Portunus trituberculatus]
MVHSWSCTFSQLLSSAMQESGHTSMGQLTAKSGTNLHRTSFSLPQDPCLATTNICAPSPH